MTSSPHQSDPVWLEPVSVLKAIEEQVLCYRSLAKLAARQHAHVQNDSTEELLGVLKERQVVVERLSILEQSVGPARRDWSNFSARLPLTERTRAETMMTEARSLLAEITSGDERDALALQQRKHMIGTEIRTTQSAVAVNRSYAATRPSLSSGPTHMSAPFTEIQTGEIRTQAEVLAAAEAPDPVSPEQGFEPDDGPTARAFAQQQRIEELGRIIMAYSEVTERLQKSHEQLTLTVQKLRTELGEKDRQLERRKRLAALGEMAAGMAHEIRNPLGAIQLYASMLAGDVRAMPESARLVEKIAGGVRRMEDIVTKVLQFSRDLRVTLSPGDVAGLAGECVEHASTRAVSKGVRLRLEGPATCPARYDRTMLAQAVLNLVLNAVDATPEGKAVTVAWGTEGARTFVRVSDEGPGVPVDAMDKIFNPFFTTKDDGTGLGLAIVHRVVEAHDGAITVRNTEGSGAVFEVRW
jgi:signal transduction histidine kinase